MEFLGRGSDLSHSSDLCCSCSNVRSFNPLCRAGESNLCTGAERCCRPHCTTAGTPTSLIVLRSWFYNHLDVILAHILGSANLCYICWFSQPIISSCVVNASSSHPGLKAIFLVTTCIFFFWSNISNIQPDCTIISVHGFHVLTLGPALFLIEFHFYPDTSNFWGICVVGIWMTSIY